MDRGNRRLQYLIAFAASIASATFGVSFSWCTPVIAKFQNNETDFKLTSEEISWIVAIGSIGYLFGSLLSRYTSDRFGRRQSLLISAVPTFLGTVILIVSWKAWAINVSRFLRSIGSGMIGTVSMVYLAEISDKDIRGQISIANRVMFSLGCFLVMAGGSAISYDTLNYVTLVLPVLYFFSCWWIPETPYYLIKENKVDAARNILKKLTNIKNENLLEEKLSQMRSDVKKEMSRSSSSKELFTGKQYRRAIIIVVGIKVGQLMSGTHTLQNYVGLITLESNSGMPVLTALIIFGAVKFVLGIMSSILVDWIGRRPLMVYSFIGTAIVYGIVGAYYFIQKYVQDKTPSIYDYIPFVGIIGTVIISILGYESVVYLIPAELFPLNIKSVAMTWFNIVGGLVSFVSSKTYQQIKDVAGMCGVFWFFGLFALFGAVFSYFFLPETKGKSLREIQIELQGNIYDDESKHLNGLPTDGIGIADPDKLTELEILNMENKHES